MATVIDALVVTLGLDPKGVQKGGKEATTAFGKVTQGATKMGKEVSAGVDSAADSFRDLQRNALAFFAVLTAGKTLKAFIADTTSSNVAAGNLARNLGTSVKSLTTWQRAAQAMGGTAEDVSSSMGSLVSQFQTIEGRRNLGLVFGQLHVNLTDANGQLRSMNELMPDLAASAQQLGPQLFSALGGQAGFSQGFINLLEQGPEKVRALYQSLQRYAPTERDTKASAQLYEDWTKLTAQSEAFGRSLMTSLTPEVHELFRTISNLVDTRADGWLASIKYEADQFNASVQSVNWREVGDEIKRWLDYLRSINWQAIGQDVKIFAGGADDAAQAIGGWTRAAEVLFGLWVGAKFLQVLANVRALAGAAGLGLGGLGKIIVAAGAHEALNAADPNDSLGAWIDNNIPGASFIDNAASKVGLGRSYAQQDAINRAQRADPATMIKIAQMAVASGWSREQAMGLLANGVRESNLDPFATGDKGGAYGIFQWHADRKARYAQRYGHSMQSVTDRDTALREQMDFANWELTHTERQAGDLLRKANNAGVAGAIVSRYFERPQDQGGEVERRGALADHLNSTSNVVGAALSASLSGEKSGSDDKGDNISRYMEGMRAAINAPPPSSVDNSSTHNVTNHVTVNAPGGDPKAVTHAVKQAFNDLGFSSRQTARGLV